MNGKSGKPSDWTPCTSVLEDVEPRVRSGCLKLGRNRALRSPRRHIAVRCPYHRSLFLRIQLAPGAPEFTVIVNLPARLTATNVLSNGRWATGEIPVDHLLLL